MYLLLKIYFVFGIKKRVKSLLIGLCIHHKRNLIINFEKVILFTGQFAMQNMKYIYATTLYCKTIYIMTNNFS